MNTYILSILVLFSNGHHLNTTIYDFPSYSKCIEAAHLAEPTLLKEKWGNSKATGYIYSCKVKR